MRRWNPSIFSNLHSYSDASGAKARKFFAWYGAAEAAPFPRNLVHPKPSQLWHSFASPAMLRRLGHTLPIPSRTFFPGRAEIRCGRRPGKSW